MRAAAFLEGIGTGMQIRRDRKQRDEDREARAEVLDELRNRPSYDASDAGTSFTLEGDGGGAPSLIRHFEGYRDTPYWDTNAYRVGYGSDTVTLPDGTVQPVKQGMTITRADAERDLARRTAEFQARARAQAGGAWDSLPPPATAALTSVAYNYGSLPKRILPAVRSGDPEAIAAAIEGLSGDNDGINARRRAREAAIVRSGMRDPQVWGALNRYAAAA